MWVEMEGNGIIGNTNVVEGRMTMSSQLSNPSVITGPSNQAVDATQQYCLRWNSYPATVATQLASLRIAEEFVDVTLACEGQQIRAHQLVLSACSPYFMQLFKSTPCQHPVVFLKDVRFSQLKALLEFMYAGEVNVSQTELPSLLRTAEALQIRGLADTTSNNTNPQHPTKPIYSQHQQYASTSNQPVPLSPSVLPAISPQQQQNTSSLNIPMNSTPNPPTIPPDILNPSNRIPTPADLPSKIMKREVNQENDSSKENQVDGSSSESNDSPESEYNVHSCYDKEGVHVGQSLLPSSENAFGNICAIDDRDGGQETWNLGEFDPMTMGDGSQSECESSEDENCESDGLEMKDDFVLPESGAVAVYNQQGDATDNKLNQSTTDNSTDPSMNTISSIPFSAISKVDKSKDLTIPGGVNILGEQGILTHTGSSNPVEPSQPHPRNRLSRTLWPPGVGPHHHHGPQPTQCPYCPRILSNVGNWRKHVMTMHFAREKNHKCRHCNSSFRTPEYLQKHYVRVHSYAPKMTRKKGQASIGAGNTSHHSEHHCTAGVVTLINNSINLANSPHLPLPHEG